MTADAIYSARIQAFRRSLEFQQYLYDYLQSLAKTDPRIRNADLLQPEETVFSGFLLSGAMIKSINLAIGSERCDAIDDFVTVIELSEGMIAMKTVLLYQCMIQRGSDFLKDAIIESIDRFPINQEGLLHEYNDNCPSAS